MDKNDFRRELKQDLKVMKRNKIITALAFIALGVILLAWPGATLLAVSKALGLVLAIGGVAAVVMYFVNGSRAIYSYAGLAGGVVVAVLGIWLFLNPTFLINLFPTIVGLLLIISGLVNFSEAFTLKKEHDESVLVPILLAAVTVVLGVAILFLQQQFAELVMRLMGIALVYDGVTDLLFISKLTGVVREIEVTARQVVHDAEAVDITETAKEVEPEAPAEEAPAEETPVAEPEAPAEEAPAEEPAEEPAVEEEPVSEETPVEETPTEAAPEAPFAQPEDFVTDETETEPAPAETSAEDVPAATETFIDESSTEE